MSDLDDLSGFMVYAGWGNDGSADLSMGHDTCGWSLDEDAIPGAVAPKVHGHPFEGSASLQTLAEEALLHMQKSHPPR